MKTPQPAPLPVPGSLWAEGKKDRHKQMQMKRYKAGFHASEKGKYEWLSSRLEAARQFDAAERAAKWAREHECIACDLLGIQRRGQ